jgi:hypothetical protein
MRYDLDPSLEVDDVDGLAVAGRPEKTCKPANYSVFDNEVSKV